MGCPCARARERHHCWKAALRPISISHRHRSSNSSAALGLETMSDVSAVFSNIEFRIRMEKIFIVIHNDNKEYKNNYYQIQFEFRNSDYQNHNFQLHLQYSQLEFELTMILKLLLLLTIWISIWISDLNNNMQYFQFEFEFNIYI